MAIQASLPFPLNNSMQYLTESGAASPSGYGLHGSLEQQPMQQSTALVPNTSHSSRVPSSSMDISYILATEMEKQREELDLYLRLQNERLRAAIHQQRTWHAASLIALVQSKASRLLRQKEKDLEKARRRALELEELLRSAEEQKSTWERLAKENEAMAAAVSDSLERALREPCCSTRAAVEEVAESTAGMGRGNLLCRLCVSRDSCVLLIPCRHLCVCKPCATSLDACPICGSVKMETLDVLLP